MATYNPSVIRTFANRLYVKAFFVILFYTVAGFFVGGFVGYLPIRWLIISNFLSFRETSDAQMLFVVLSSWLVGTVTGLLIGIWRSFALRLQAQTALCLVAIEENTRRIR